MMFLDINVHSVGMRWPLFRMHTHRVPIEDMFAGIGWEVVVHHFDVAGRRPHLHGSMGLTGLAGPWGSNTRASSPNPEHLAGLLLGSSRN